ncbi:MAG: hypothetical protein AABY22_18625, partial [Nanoarchaeota archaeon]
IEKEKEHLKFLKEHKEKIVRKNPFSLFFFCELQNVKDEMNKMITTSQNMLKHLETRLKEYKDYIKTA